MFSTFFRRPRTPNPQPLTEPTVESLSAELVTLRGAVEALQKSEWERSAQFAEMVSKLDSLMKRQAQRIVRGKENSTASNEESPLDLRNRLKR